MSEPVLSDDDCHKALAIVCLDLDVLLECAEHGRLDTVEKLVRQIRHTVKKKDRVLADAKNRDERYRSMMLIDRACAAGLVRSEPFGDRR